VRMKDGHKIQMLKNDISGLMKACEYWKNQSDHFEEEARIWRKDFLELQKKIKQGGIVENGRRA